MRYTLGMETVNWKKSYDIQRGINYRLTKELDTLKASYESKLEAKYSKEIHSLNYALQLADAKLKKAKSDSRKKTQHINHLHDEILNTEDEIERIRNEYDKKIEEFEKMIEQMRKQVEDMEGKIKKLSAQLNRDYTNSSIPSSRDENHKLIANSRVKTGNKPGAQCGHKASYRRTMTPTEPIVELIPDEVNAAPDKWIKTDRCRMRQVVDIEMTVKCTQYNAYGYKNIETGRMIYSAFPSNVVNEMNYGEGIKALCCFLTSYCNVSIRKAETLIKSLTGDKVTISTGTIYALTKELADKTKAERDEIVSGLLKSPYLHNDATGVRINGSKWNIYVTANEDGVIYNLSRKKGIEGISRTPLNLYANTVIHDHDTSYYNDSFHFSSQECLAHLERYCQDSIDNEPDLKWNKAMKHQIQEMIHRKKIGELDIDEVYQKYQTIIGMAMEEYEQNPPSKYYRDGFNLAKRLKKYQEETLAFMYNDELPYTNNLAERKLRACKMKIKAATTFRSSESVTNYCDVMSVIETAIQHNQNIYETMKQGFSK